MKGIPEVIEALNRALTIELTAINQYFCQAKMCKNWGFLKLGNKHYEESMGEMKHAEMLIDRILFLEGTPGDRPLRRDPRRHRRQGAVRERPAARDGAASSSYNELIDLCIRVKDNGTRELVEPILTESEEHVDWLETQLGLIEAVGLQNYLTEQMGSDEDEA